MAYRDQLLAPGEVTRYVARQHVLFLIGRIAGRVLLAVLLVAAGVAGKVLLPPRAGETVGNAAIFLALLLALVALFEAFGRTLAWRNEEFIVTNRRVIRIQGVFAKRTIDSSLNMINDLLTNQSIAGRIAGYGDVRIITGNDVADEFYQGIADPLAFKRALLASRDDLMHELSGSGAHPVYPGPGATPEYDPAQIPTLIAQLADLAARGAITRQEYEAKRVELLRRL